MPFANCDLYLLSIDHVLNLQSKFALKILANKLIVEFYIFFSIPLPVSWMGRGWGNFGSGKLLLWWRWRASRAPLCFYSRAESGWNSFLPTHPTMETGVINIFLAYKRRRRRNLIIRFPLIQFIRVSKSFEKIPIFDFPSSWDYISFNTFLLSPLLELLLRCSAGFDWSVWLFEIEPDHPFWKSKLLW